MRKHLIATLTSLVLAGGTLLAFLAAMLVADGSSDRPPDGTVTTVFRVDGMTCGGCEVGVRLNVKELDGVEKVEVSYKLGRATVTYDAAKVSPEQIVEAIEELGYKAETLKPAESADSGSSDQRPASGGQHAGGRRWRVACS